MVVVGGVRLAGGGGWARIAWCRIAVGPKAGVLHARSAKMSRMWHTDDARNNFAVIAWVWTMPSAFDV